MLSVNALELEQLAHSEFLLVEGLLELLSNRPYLDTVTDDSVAETREQLSMMWEDDADDIDVSKFKLDSTALHDVEDKPSYQQMIDAGYIMSDDGFWLEKPDDEEV